MEKIPTVFKRDPSNMSRLLDEINPECQWVFDGEGVATRKYDGTCVMFDENGDWWARREVKPGKKEPENFVQVHFDPNTGKKQGWEPISQSSFIKAFDDAIVVNFDHEWSPGTYELVGPKINGNPEKLERHDLLSHERAEVFGRGENAGPIEPEAVRNLITKTCAYLEWEGIVWHHPDGRMAKLKVRDFHE